MASFKVPCPSCEAPVLIKNPNLVGTKVECPKCKYRFKVEEPAAEGEAGKDKKGDAKDKKADGKDKKAETKKAAAPGKKKKLVPILVGVGAVVVLAVVGIAVLGGGDGKSKGGGYTGGPGGPGNPNGTQPNPDGDKPTPPVDPGPPPVPVSTKNATHLLPGQAVAVYRFNLDKVRESQVYDPLVDGQVAAMFKDSMGFPVSDVDTYLHCFAGDNRDPFGVIKLKAPVKEADTLAAMAKTLQPKPKAVNGRNLHTMRPNPFVTAVSAALSMRALFGDFFDRVPMGPSAGAKSQDKPLGVCVYDTQHILIGDYALLDRFLGELDASGYPPFKTTLISAPAAPSAPTPPVPGAPPGMPGMPGAPPMPGTPPMPGAPPTPPAAAPAAPPAAGGGGDKAYTSVDAYRSLEYPIKKALDDLEADRNAQPMFVYAEKFDIRHYDPRMLKKDYGGLADLLNPIAPRVRYVSANVVTFSMSRLVANLRVTFESGDDARTVAKDQLDRGLRQTADLLKLILLTPVEFRDYTVGGSASSGLPPSSPMGLGYPGMGVPPGGPPPGPGMMGQPPLGMGMGFPGGPPPRPGVSPGGPPPAPGTMGQPPLGMGMGSPGGPPPRPGGPPPGPGVPPGGPPPAPGTMGQPPLGMGMGFPGGPPPGPGTGTWPTDPNPQTTPTSHLDLGMTGDQLLIAIDLIWSEPVNRTIVGPWVMGLTNQIKGKMAVFTSEYSWHALAMAGPKALEDPERKAFPRGTWARKSNSERFGLEYPPVQRVSLFVDLLPYLGRGQLASGVNKNLAWFDERNLDAAGAWVPELLVPDYPQSAWRATSPFAPDHFLGATNYVAVAGVGLDIARADPTDPRSKKLVGITGYGWGSKAEEVTDGLSNTIYLMQTPPGLQQAWIAGGGATVRGLDPDSPMAAFKYTQRGRTKQGTYALMGDGSVRFIPEDIDPKVLKALATRAGDDNKDLADIETTAPKVELPKATTELKTDPKPADKKPEEKKPADPKAVDPKATDPKADPKKEPPKAPGGKADPAPAPADKK